MKVINSSKDKVWKQSQTLYTQIYTIRGIANFSTNYFYRNDGTSFSHSRGTMHHSPQGLIKLRIQKIFNEIENQCQIADKIKTSKLDETIKFSYAFQCFCYGSFKKNNKEN